MQSEMSRREFLGFMGAATLGIVGVTGLIKGLNGLAGRHTGAGSGYGDSPYGGGSDSGFTRGR